jgi:hypothetical protein
MTDPGKDIDPPETDPADPPEIDPDTKPEDLGAAGQQAIHRMKAERNEAKKQLREAKAQLAELTKPKPDDKPDAEAIRKAAREEAMAETLGDRALDKLEVRAAKLFADPDDARAMLAGRAAEFVDDGKIDTDAIDEALQDLLKRKPHLGAKPESRFQGSADGGARKGSKPDQLTRDDLKKMSPDQIVKAKTDGRLANLMGVDS